MAQFPIRIHSDAYIRNTYRHSLTSLSIVTIAIHKFKPNMRCGYGIIVVVATTVLRVNWNEWEYHNEFKTSQKKETTTQLDIALVMCMLCTQQPTPSRFYYVLLRVSCDIFVVGGNLIHWASYDRPKPEIDASLSIQRWIRRVVEFFGTIVNYELIP